MNETISTLLAAVVGGALGFIGSAYGAHKANSANYEIKKIEVKLNDIKDAIKAIDMLFDTIVFATNIEYKLPIEYKMSITSLKLYGSIYDNDLHKEITEIDKFIMGLRSTDKKPEVILDLPTQVYNIKDKLVNAYNSTKESLKDDFCI